MKRTTLFITSLVLMVGCSKPINDETLIHKGGLKYHPDTKELYSGKVFKNRMGGKKEFEGSYKDGKKDGKWTEWFKDGQKEEEGTYFKGEDKMYEIGKKILKVGLWTYWYENGQKWYERTYKDGKEDGLWTKWYKNGQMEREETYKDGNIVSYKRWNEDGSVNND